MKWYKIQLWLSLKRECSHQQLPAEDLQQSGEHVSIPQVVVEVRYATGHSGEMGVNPLGEGLLLHRISFICGKYKSQWHSKEKGGEKEQSSFYLLKKSLLQEIWNENKSDLIPNATCQAYFGSTFINKWVWTCSVNPWPAKALMREHSNSFELVHSVSQNPEPIGRLLLFSWRWASALSRSGEALAIAPNTLEHYIYTCYTSFQVQRNHINQLMCTH